MKTLIIKFGGSILDTPEDFKKCISFIKKHKNKNKLVIVVSALKNTTDQLIEMFKTAEQGNKFEAQRMLADLSERHIHICDNQAISSNLNELDNILHAVAYMRELTQKTYAKAISIGEKLSADLLTYLLNEEGINATECYAEDFLFTDDDFLEATPHLNKIKKNISIKSQITIIPGFTGVNDQGMATLLGRGGSDFTATILANVLNAKEVCLVKDVGKVMSADPNVVSDAHMITHLSYQEASELSYFGSKILHPRCLGPVKEKNIPLIIKSVNEPLKKGTIISTDVQQNSSPVKALSIINDVMLISIEGEEMVGRPEVTARIFDVLWKKNIHVIMISQASSACNLTLLVSKVNGEKAKQYLEQSPFYGKQISKLNLLSNISLIAVVGAGMQHTPGIAGKLFLTMGKEKINIIAIAQGSSEYNISFVVSKKDASKAVKALHTTFHSKE